MFNELTPLMDEKSVYDVMMIWYDRWKEHRSYLVTCKETLTSLIDSYYPGAKCSVVELDTQNPSTVKVQFTLSLSEFIFFHIVQGSNGIEFSKVLTSNPTHKTILQNFSSEHKSELETIYTTIEQYHQQFCFQFLGSQSSLSYKVEAKDLQFTIYFQDGLDKSVNYLNSCVVFKPEFNRLEIKMLKKVDMTDTEIREVLLSLGLRNSTDIPTWIQEKL